MLLIYGRLTGVLRLLRYTLLVFPFAKLCWVEVAEKKWAFVFYFCVFVFKVTDAEFIGCMPCFHRCSILICITSEYVLYLVNHKTGECIENIYTCKYISHNALIYSYQISSWIPGFSCNLGKCNVSKLFIVFVDALCVFVGLFTAVLFTYLLVLCRCVYVTYPYILLCVPIVKRLGALATVDMAVYKYFR